MQKERLLIAENGIAPFAATTSRLCYLGGLTYYTYSNGIETLFTAQNPNDRKTAQFIYDYDIEYFAKNNGQYWGELLSRAGVQN